MNATDKIVYETTLRYTAPDYLEIGVSEGDSLLSVLTNPNVRFAVGVDNWGIYCGGTNRGSPDHLLPLLGKNLDRVLLITGSSHVILPGMRHQFDVIYVDGDHSTNGAMQDLDDCSRLLAPGGVLLADDMDNPHHRLLRPATIAWAERNGFTIKMHEVMSTLAEMARNG